jgi:hypothetical protein
MGNTKTTCPRLLFDSLWIGKRMLELCPELEFLNSLWGLGTEEE